MNQLYQLFRKQGLLLNATWSPHQRLLKQGHLSQSASAMFVGHVLVIRVVTVVIVTLILAAIHALAHVVKVTDNMQNAKIIFMIGININEL